MMKAHQIGVIDYGTGNLRSVVKAFEHLGTIVSLVLGPNDLKHVDAVVFPGQGSFDQCMSSLNRTGLNKSLKNWIHEERPFFGICLGLQVLFECSEEGELAGMGLFQGKAMRFPSNSGIKVPHMGWNHVKWGLPTEHWARKDIYDDDQFYFVHSYRVETDDQRVHSLYSEYGEKFTSGIISANCIATQFHPEKSQSKGIQLYRNFLENIE